MHDCIIDLYLLTFPEQKGFNVDVHVSLIYTSLELHSILMQRLLEPPVFFKGREYNGHPKEDGIWFS